MAFTWKAKLETIYIHVNTEINMKFICKIEYYKAVKMNETGSTVIKLDTPGKQW